MGGVTLTDYWTDGMKTYHGFSSHGFPNCTPGYYNNEGHFEPGADGFGANSYAPGINAFNALMAKWREKGDLEGLELG